MNHNLLWGVAAVAGLILISPPQSEAEARRRSRQLKGLMSLAVAAGCIWFAWWVLSTHCNGGC